MIRFAPAGVRAGLSWRHAGHFAVTGTRRPTRCGPAHQGRRPVVSRPYGAVPPAPRCVRATSARHRTRPRAADRRRGLGRRRLRREDPAQRRRLGRLRLERARRGLRPQGPAARRPGLPLPRRRRGADARSRTSAIGGDARKAAAREGPGRRRRHARPGTPQARLQGLGLDLTEHGDARLASRSCCTAPPTRRSCAARASTTRSGSPTSRRAPRRTAAADRRFAARASSRRALPSGRTAYRRLADYELEMKQLAARYPSARQAGHAQHETARGPRRQRHRDHAQRRDTRGRQADLPATWASTTPASGRRRSTRWSSPTTC